MSKHRTFLVVGTSAGVGKTVVAAALVRRLRAAGHLAAGLKPVETGCVYSEDHDLVAKDGEALSKVASWVPPYVVAPYRFASSAPPREAAGTVGTDLRIDDLASAITAGHRYADIVVAEGWGKATDRIADDGDQLDLAAKLDAALVIATRADEDVPAIVDSAKARGVSVACVIERAAERPSVRSSTTGEPAGPNHVQVPDRDGEGDAADAAFDAGLDAVDIVNLLLPPGSTPR